MSQAWARATHLFIATASCACMLLVVGCGPPEACLEAQRVYSSLPSDETYSDLRFTKVIKLAKEEEGSEHETCRVAQKLAKKIITGRAQAAAAARAVNEAATLRKEAALRAKERVADLDLQVGEDEVSSGPPVALRGPAMHPGALWNISIEEKWQGVGRTPVGDGTFKSGLAGSALDREQRVEVLKVAGNGMPTRLRVQQVRDRQLFEMDGAREEELAPWAGKSLVYLYDADGRCTIEPDKTKPRKKKKKSRKKRRKKRRRRAQTSLPDTEASSDLGCPPLSFGLYPVGAVSPGEPWTPRPAAVRAALGLAPDVGLTIKSSAMRLLGVEDPEDQPRYARVSWKLRCNLRYPDATAHEWDVMISIKRSLSSFVDIERKVEGKRVIMEPASAGGMRFEGEVSTTVRVTVERRPGVDP